MLPDRVSNPGPLTYESGALPIALRGPAQTFVTLTYLDFLESINCPSNRHSSLKKNTKKRWLNVDSTSGLSQYGG